MKNNNIKKIVFEIILIPLCMLYLLYTLLENNPKISLMVCMIIIIITSLELSIKYSKEVYEFKNKYNILKTIFSIFNIMLIIVTGLTFLYKYMFLKIAFIIMTIILLIFLLIYSVKNIISILKEKGTLYKKALASFLGLMSFVSILITLIISYSYLLK